MEQYFGLTEFETLNPLYKCLCSKKYIEKILISLGKKELENIIKEEGDIKVSCQFCGKKYVFNNEDVDRFFK